MEELRDKDVFVIQILHRLHPSFLQFQRLLWLILAMMWLFFKLCYFCY